MTHLTGGSWERHAGGHAGGYLLKFLILVIPAQSQPGYNIKPFAINAARQRSVMTTSMRWRLTGPPG